MSAEVLSKDLRERAVPVLALSIGIGLLTIAGLGVYAGMSGTLDELTEDFPEELMSFIGGNAPGGYVVGEVFNLLAPVALVAYAVLTGASALAGEEQRKTMGVLLGAPVSRTRVLVAKAGGLVLSLVAAIAAFLLAAVAASTWFDVGLESGNIIATVVHLGALTLFFGLLALAVGAATGQPALAAGVAGGAAVLSYLADSTLPLAGLDRWAELSPWFYYAGSEPLANGFDLQHLLVLVALALAAFAAALITFNRRDLRG